MHLLTTDEGTDVPASEPAPFQHVSVLPRPPIAPEPQRNGLDDRITKLEAEVATLRTELNELREELGA